MTHDRQVVASLALTERGPFDVYCFLLRKTYSRSLSKHDRVCIAAYLRGSTLLFVLRLRNKLVHRATEFALHGEVFLAGKACRHPMNAAFIAASASGAFLIQPAANDLADARVALPQCDPSFGSVSGAALTYDAMAFLFADSLYTCGGAFPALGHGRFVESKHLARVQAFRGKRVLQVALGAGHCAVICDDHLYTFGCGEDGQLGHGDCKTQLLPLRVQNSAMVGVQRVACGELHTVVMWTDHVAVFGNGVALMPCKIDSLQGHQMIDVAAGGRCTAVATAAGVYVLDAAFRQLHRVNGVASVLAIPGCVQFLGCPVDADEAEFAVASPDGIIRIHKPRFWSTDSWTDWVRGRKGLLWDATPLYQNPQHIKSIATSEDFVAYTVSLHAEPFQPPAPTLRRSFFLHCIFTRTFGGIGLALGGWLGYEAARVLPSSLFAPVAFVVVVVVTGHMWTSTTWGQGHALQLGLASGLCLGFVASYQAAPRTD